MWYEIWKGWKKSSEKGEIEPGYIASEKSLAHTLPSTPLELLLEYCLL